MLADSNFTAELKPTLNESNSGQWFRKEIKCQCCCTHSLIHYNKWKENHSNLSFNFDINLFLCKGLWKKFVHFVEQWKDSLFLSFNDQICMFLCKMFYKIVIYIHFFYPHSHTGVNIFSLTIEIISGILIASAQFYNLKITPKNCDHDH